MELTREERAIRGGSRTVATNIKERSKMSLFKSFYKDIMDEDCEEEALNIMERVMESAERGVE